MKKIILVLLIALPFNAWSQSIEIKGKILDEATNLVIPFATVAVKHKGVGVAAGEDGVFNLSLQNYTVQDSLEFKALGYEDYCVSLPDFLEWVNSKVLAEIRLVPIAFLLNEIVIFPAKTEEVHGVRSNSTLGPGYSFNAGTQVILFIPNEEGRRGIIKSIAYFFTDKHRKPKAPFRVKVIRADQAGNPESEILLESIVVSAPKGEEWFTVDLEKHNLLIPETGYFAGLELVNTGKQHQFKAKHPTGSGRKLKKVTFQGPSLGMAKTFPPSKTWIGKLGRGWRKYPFVDSDGYSRDYMIRSTVKYLD